MKTRYGYINGQGNVTQIAISYGNPCDEIYFRGRYEGSWTLWRRLWTDYNFNPGLLVLPVGSIIWVPYASPPAGYLKANGSTLSRTVYASLFAHIGTTFGAGAIAGRPRRPRFRTSEMFYWRAWCLAANG